MKEHLFKVMKSDLAIYGSLKTFTCPRCGKHLMNLAKDEAKREFWCDDCGDNYIIEIVEDED